MIIDNIYQNKLLRYPLNVVELHDVPKAMKLLDIIKRPYYFAMEYRKYTIKEVRKKFSIREFYKYERILNKLFWNLRWLLYPLFYPELSDTVEKYIDTVTQSSKLENIPDALSICSKTNYVDDADMKYKTQNSDLFNTHYYRSYINKLMIVDKKNKVIYKKDMEGQSEIFGKNMFNLLCMTIFFDDNLYNKVMENPFSIKDNFPKLPKFYHQMDYGFPNLNLCCYSFGKKKERIKRIKKMYYYNGVNYDKYWQKLIV